MKLTKTFCSEEADIISRNVTFVEGIFPLHFVRIETGHIFDLSEKTNGFPLKTFLAAFTLNVP